MSRAFPDWNSEFQNLAYLLDTPACSTQIKKHPEDFVVSEELGFPLNGEGEHLFLYIEKKDWNTQDLAVELAKQVGIKVMDVGFSGLKDRFAVTRQWFSLYLPGKTVEIPEIDQCDVLESTRHNKKLKRGVHKGNRFQIRLRDCIGDRENWNKRLQTIAETGFPNYFTEQRFGRRFSNLDHATRLFGAKSYKTGKAKRAMYLSAARAWLFNKICSARIDDNTWGRPTAGEMLILDGSRSFFIAENTIEEKQRFQDQDIHTSGPLWGRLKESDNQYLARELAILENEALFRSGLENTGMKMERRSLRAIPGKLTWAWQGDSVLNLDFYLQKGSYATALLRELANIK